MPIVSWIDPSDPNIGRGQIARSRDTIDVYLTDPDRVTDATILVQLATILDEDERARHDKFVFPNDRHDFLVSHAFLRCVLARHADVHPAAWRFTANRHGRPEIATPAIAGLHFNLSHTRGLVAVAVAWEREVGVDVENTSRSAPLDVAKRMFADDELHAMRMLAPSRDKRFFELWTLKEAYAKARWQGFALPWKEFSFDLDATQGEIHFQSQSADERAAGSSSFSNQPPVTVWPWRMNRPTSGTPSSA